MNYRAEGGRVEIRLIKRTLENSNDRTERVGRFELIVLMVRRQRQQDMGAARSRSSEVVY